jgi:coenzyme F420-dependent glucose-6-phosphate dehydrogenase
MAAAAERTQGIGIGSGVTVPMFKYHPAVVAQAFATLACLFPGRIKIAVGTGEPINENPFIDTWPSWKVRGEMLVEAVELIRKFWNSDDYFTHEGKYFKAKNIFCYDNPPKPVPIYFSAYGPKAAVMAGKYGDALLTWGLKFDFTRETIIPNFEKGARSVGRDPKAIEKVAWIDIGYGDPKELLEKFRRSSAAWFLPANYDEADPRKTEKNAYTMSDQEIRKMAIVTENTEDFIRIAERSRKEGMNHVIFSDSSAHPDTTIAAFGRDVLPHFAKG